jgi:hypothetical protein
MALFCAAILKTYSDHLSNRFAPVRSIEEIIEDILGAALLFSVWPSRTRVAGIVFFALAFSFAVVEFLHHKSSCGCFGRVPVPPWATASFDALAVAALVVSQPVQVKTSKPRLIFAGAILIASVGVCAAMELTRPPVVHLADTDTLGAPGSLVVLEPEKWIGQPFPIADHIDIASQLAHGRWIVLLVHHDCDHCLAAIARYQSADLGSARLAIIEMPPYADADQKLADAPALLGRVDTQRDWFASTPVALMLEDGKVIHSAESDTAENPNPAWWAK